MGLETFLVGFLCMFFDAGISITWASGRGLGPGNLEFFRDKMTLIYRLNAISQSPKNSQFLGPNPLPLALVMDMHASKTLRTGFINELFLKRYIKLKSRNAGTHQALGVSRLMQMGVGKWKGNSSRFSRWNLNTTSKGSCLYISDALFSLCAEVPPLPNKIWSTN